VAEDLTRDDMAAAMAAAGTAEAEVLAARRAGSSLVSEHPREDGPVVIRTYRKDKFEPEAGPRNAPVPRRDRGRKQAEGAQRGPEPGTIPSHGRAAPTPFPGGACP
jgi:hypothetical protein